MMSGKKSKLIYNVIICIITKIETLYIEAKQKKWCALKEQNKIKQMGDRCR